MLNTEQYDYIAYGVGHGSEAGYFVNIHDPNTHELRPADNGYFAPVGSTTRISLQKERVGLHPYKMDVITYPYPNLF